MFEIPFSNFISPQKNYFFKLGRHRSLEATSGGALAWKKSPTNVERFKKDHASLFEFYKKQAKNFEPQLYDQKELHLWGKDNPSVRVDLKLGKKSDLNPLNKATPQEAPVSALFMISKGRSKKAYRCFQPNKLDVKQCDQTILSGRLVMVVLQSEFAQYWQDFPSNKISFLVLPDPPTPTCTIQASGLQQSQPTDTPFSFRNAAILAINKFEELRKGAGYVMIMDDNVRQPCQWKTRDGVAKEEVSLVTAIRHMVDHASRESLDLVGSQIHRPRRKKQEAQKLQGNVEAQEGSEMKETSKPFKCVFKMFLIRSSLLIEDDPVLNPPVFPSEDILWQAALRDRRAAKIGTCQRTIIHHQKMSGGCSELRGWGKNIVESDGFLRQFEKVVPVALLDKFRKLVESSRSFEFEESLYLVTWLRLFPVELSHLLSARLEGCFKKEESRYRSQQGKKDPSYFAPEIPAQDSATQLYQKAKSEEYNVDGVDPHLVFGYMRGGRYFLFCDGCSVYTEWKSDAKQTPPQCKSGAQCKRPSKDFWASYPEQGDEQGEVGYYNLEIAEFKNEWDSAPELMKNFVKGNKNEFQTVHVGTKHWQLLCRRCVCTFEGAWAVDRAENHLRLSCHQNKEAMPRAMHDGFEQWKWQPADEALDIDTVAGHMWSDTVPDSKKKLISDCALKGIFLASSSNDGHWMLCQSCNKCRQLKNLDFHICPGAPTKISYPLSTAYNGPTDTHDFRTNVQDTTRLC